MDFKNMMIKQTYNLTNITGNMCVKWYFIIEYVFIDQCFINITSISKWLLNFIQNTFAFAWYEASNHFLCNIFSTVT